ncbi:MAG: DEAD/DEAH box helicase [Bacteroides sp.]|nr:DEAD/DEAH box helicase [Bacteroides sp.]
MKEKEIRALLASKEGIEALNDMQEKMLRTASEKKDIILLAPTGSGKTVAFSVPLLKMLKDPTGRLQAIVIAPSRELVLQIAGVLRNIGGDFRVVPLYGGHKVEDEINSLKVVPDIIVATPGRLLDHMKRGNIDVWPTRILVLDEFDKSLELGFEEDMEKIVGRLKNVSRIILTSATEAASLPEFLPIKDPGVVSFLDDNTRLRKRMNVREVRSDGKDKLQSLLTLLRNITPEDGRPGRTIIFANHRESAERIYAFLRSEGVDAALYTGALEQRRRESALEAFNSGARPVLVATDLAARGLDIEGVENVVHYHLPLTPETYTHRNGRTARVASEGNVYILLGPEEELKEYMETDGGYSLDPSRRAPLRSGLETLCIGAGRREKLSKGDILGFITKDAGVPGADVGRIAVFDHYSLVTLAAPAAQKVVEASRRSKIKGEKRRVSNLDSI